MEHVKIKVMLNRQGIIISRRKIGKIMSKYGLVSNYTIKQFKKYKTKVNEDKLENLVERKFNNRRIMEVVVSDLTYVNVAGKWHYNESNLAKKYLQYKSLSLYICLILDVARRKIIGYSASKNKDTQLVKKAFYSIKSRLSDIQIFHTDRGCEFKNNIIDEIITSFNIKRSLSKKGCPYDNAIAEATYKIIKTEFAFNKVFHSFDELKYLLFDYVNWFNNFRIHGALNFLSHSEFELLLSNN